MPFESPVDEPARAARRDLLKMFGFMVPAAVISLPTPVADECNTDPVITPRDIFEIHLEAAINSMPMQYWDAAKMPGSLMRSLFEANAIAAAHVYAYQQRILRSV
jgi:hypothetical protein